MALVRLVRGDLDWIVMKCLEKDRTRRYETTSALAADVQRHLVGEPVVAAPPSRLYRLSKTLQRHRTAAAVATSFVLLIAAGLAATGTLWRQAAHARDAESDQRARAEAINTFLKDMLTAADPAKAKGEKLTVREALDTAAKRIEERPIKDQPLVEAELRTTIGATYFSLSLYAQAESQFRSAEAIYGRELGNAHPDMLRTRIRLAETLLYRSEYAAALAAAEPTVGACRRELGPEHVDTLRAMVILGRTLTEVGRFAEGEALLLAAIEGKRRVLGAEHADTADALKSLGLVYVLHGAPVKAEPLFREAWQIQSAALGEEDLRTLESLNFVGSALYNQNRSKEAEPIFRKVLEIYRRVLGPEHWQTFSALGCLGGALNRQGRYAEAEPLLRESFEACLRNLGRSHGGTITGQRFLAECLVRLGRFEEAEQLLREALQVARDTYGPEHYGTSVQVMCALTGVLAKQQKDAETVEVGREVLKLLLRMAPRPYASEVVGSAGALRTALRRQGKTDDALRVGRELLDFLVAAASESGASAADLKRAAWHLLTIEESELRDPRKALELAKRAAEQSGHENPGILDTLALAYHRTGETGKAIELQKKAISLLAADAADRAEYEDRLREFQVAFEQADDKR